MYYYEMERPKLFTAEGLTLFVELRDRTLKLLAEAGAVSSGAAIAKSCGDSWMMLACLDLMVERGELRELTGGNVAGQHRVFVKAYP